MRAIPLVFPRHLGRWAAILAGACLAAAASAAPLRVGIETYAPYTFVDASGRPTGFCVELLEAIAQRQHLQLEFVLKPWDELLGDFKAGRVDVLANVAYSRERTAFIDYSIVNTTLPAGVFVRRELAGVRSMEELRGKRFATSRGIITHEWLLTHHWTEDFLLLPALEDSLVAVDRGEADAVIYSRLVASRYLREHRLRNLVLTPVKVPDLDFNYHFGVRRGETDLLYRLNNGLTELHADGTFDRLYEKWLGALDRRPLRFKDVQPYLVPLALLLLGGLAALYRQRRNLAELARRAEALRVSEDRYRRYFEEDLAGAFISTAQGRLVASNPAFRRIFGFDPAGEITGLDVTILYPNPAARAELLAELRAGGKVEHREIEMRRCDGATVQVIGSIIGNFNDRGELAEIKGYVLDTTNQKKLEEQLRQAQKMEAVGQLAGGVAHDFNNILTAIIGNAELALLRADLRADTRAELDQIKQAGQRAAALTRQLLYFSRKEVVQPVVLNLNTVTANLEKMLCRLIGEDVQLTLALDPALGSTEADPGQIEQVIVNLAVNARDAMPRGGRLVLETANAKLDESYTRDFIGLQPGAYVQLAVSDNGCGMDPATQARIFEPFFSTKGPGKGSGLGLSTVYGIIAQNNGHIAVSSKPGAGTVFKIYLPLVAGNAAPVPPESTPDEALGGTETILLVEDNEQVRQVTRQILQAHGYNVLVAEDAAAALRLCDGARDAIQLLLTDVIMPGMNGCQLAERITAMRPGVKVVYMSGYADDAIDRQGGLTAGTGYLEKPFAPATLLRKVWETLHRS